MTRHIFTTLISSALVRASHLFNMGLMSASSGYQPPSQPPRSGRPDRGGPDRGGPNRGRQGQGEGASSLAVATLVLGIGAWTFLPILSAIVGVILGRVELNNIKRGESSQGGKMITQIGFWLSVVNIVLSVLGSCVAFALIFLVYGSLAAMLGAIGLAGAL